MRSSRPIKWLTRHPPRGRRKTVAIDGKAEAGRAASSLPVDGGDGDVLPDEQENKKRASVGPKPTLGRDSRWMNFLKTCGKLLFLTVLTFVTLYLPYVLRTAAAVWRPGEDTDFTKLLDGIPVDILTYLMHAQLAVAVLLYLREQYTRHAIKETQGRDKTMEKELKQNRERFVRTMKLFMVMAICVMSVVDYVKDNDVGIKNAFSHFQQYCILMPSMYVFMYIALEMPHMYFVSEKCRAQSVQEQEAPTTSNRKWCMYHGFFLAVPIALFHCFVPHGEDNDTFTGRGDEVMILIVFYRLVFWYFTDTADKLGDDKWSAKDEDKAHSDFDKLGNGTKADFRKYIKGTAKEMGTDPPADETIDCLFGKLDTNGDGLLEWKEVNFSDPKVVATYMANKTGFVGLSIFVKRAEAHSHTKTLRRQSHSAPARFDSTSRVQDSTRGKDFATRSWGLVKRLVKSVFSLWDWFVRRKESTRFLFLVQIPFAYNFWCLAVLVFTLMFNVGFHLLTATAVQESMWATMYKLIVFTCTMANLLKVVEKIVEVLVDSWSEDEFPVLTGRIEYVVIHPLLVLLPSCHLDDSTH